MVERIAAPVFKARRSNIRQALADGLTMDILYTTLRSRDCSIQVTPLLGLGERERTTGRALALIKVTTVSGERNVPGRGGSMGCASRCF